MISYSQEPIFKSFKIEDGLLSNETHFTLSDSKGYIWIASDAGINRYDGYSFKSYTEMDGLPESTVLRLYEDRKGRLWFSTLSSYVGYIENDRVHVLSFKFKEDVTANNENFAYSMHVDEGDTLWVGTIYSGLLFKLAPPYTAKPILKKFESDFILEFKEGGDFVYGTLSFSPKEKYQIIFIRKWNTTSKIVTSYERDIPRRKNFLRIDKDHFVFDSHSHLYRLKNDRIEHVHSFKNPIIFLSKQTQDEIWVCVYQEGLFKFRDSNFNLDSEPYYRDISFTGMTKDYEGGHWLTTFKEGVYYAPNLDFKAIFKGKSYQDVFVENNQKILVNESFGDLISYEKGKSRRVGLSAMRILPFQKDVLFTTALSDEQRYNFKENTATRLQIDYPKLVPTTLKYFSSYKNNLLGWQNYMLFMQADGQHSFDFLTAIKSRINYALMTDHRSIWIGTIDGLLHYDILSRKLTNMSKRNPLLGTRIDLIISDKKDQLWLATRGQGILLFSPKKGVQQITLRDGLPSNIILSLNEDESSNIWVGTNGGLCKIRQNEKGKIIIDNFSSLNNFDLGTIHSTDVYKNQVYLATSNGLFTFPIDELIKHSKIFKLPLYFTIVSTDNGRKIVSSSKLAYNENSLKINFLGITYKHSKDVQYEYKLDGFHSKWYRTKNQSVELLNIPSGSYIFKVRVLSGGTVLSQNQLAFEIEIPFWQAWWFYSTVILLSLGIIWFIARWRIRIIKRKEKERSDIEISFAHLESQALRAQMNPHFIFNSLNSIQRIYTEGNLKEANSFLSEFGQLIRKILENSGRTVISLKEEIETLELYLNLEQFRCKNKFTFTIEIDPAIDQYYLTIPSLIIQPFVENAIWHGIIPSKKEGVISITCEKVKDGIQVKVKDNGVGIQESKGSQHLSKGIEISEKRIGSKITISSTPGEGTEVGFILRGYDD